jgi:hypothetical protein
VSISVSAPAAFNYLISLICVGVSAAGDVGVITKRAAGAERSTRQAAQVVIQRRYPPRRAEFEIPPRAVGRCSASRRGHLPTGRYRGGEITRDVVEYPLPSLRP